MPGSLAKKKVDCSVTVIDAMNRDCLKQYCQHHPTEPRCDAE